MIRFRVVPHTLRPVSIVELWEGDSFLATIVPGEDEASFIVVSSHLDHRGVALTVVDDVPTLDVHLIRERKK